MVVSVSSLATPDQDRQGSVVGVSQGCQVEDVVQFLVRVIQDGLAVHWRESSSAVGIGKGVGQAQKPALGHLGVRQGEVVLLLL